MERRTRPYSLYRRSLTKGRPVYYAKIFDPNTGELLRRVSTGERSRYRAEDWVYSFLERERERERLEAEAAAHITVAELARDFWEPDGAYARSRRARGYTISHGHLEISEGYTRNHILPQWGSSRVADLTPGKIDTWILDLHRVGKLAPATINKLLATLRSILDRATAEGYLFENPAAFVKPVRNVHKERGVLTDSEVTALFQWPGPFDDFTQYTLNLIAFTTGARIGELRGLTVEHVHHDRVEIVQAWEDGHGLKPPKYNSVRAVPISERVYNAIQAVIDARRPESFVFYSEAGKDRPMSKSHIEKQLYKALVNLSLSDDDRQNRDKRAEALSQWRERGVCVHSWRHKLNTVLRARGVPDSKIRLLTGHRGEGMTDWYTRYAVTDFTDVRDCQSGLLEASG